MDEDVSVFHTRSWLGRIMGETGRMVELHGESDEGDDGFEATLDGGCCHGRHIVEGEQGHLLGERSFESISLQQSVNL